MGKVVSYTAKKTGFLEGFKRVSGCPEERTQKSVLWETLDMRFIKNPLKWVFVRFSEGFLPVRKREPKIGFVRNP